LFFFVHNKKFLKNKQICVPFEASELYSYIEYKHDMSNIDEYLIETLDLINYTLSDRFIERWRYRFSERFLKLFQTKLLESIKNQKPLKIQTLFNYLSSKCGYSKDQVMNFFEALEIKEMYSPIIVGKLITS